MLKKIKWFCGIVSIITSVYVGLIFYAKYMDNISVYVLLILENSLKCFLASPLLKLSEVADATFVEKRLNSTFVFYMYALSVYLAPICVGAIILDTFSNIRYALLLFVFNIKAIFSKNVIIIFGYNEMTKKLVINENNIEKNKIFYIFTIKEVTTEDRIDFINKKIIIFNFDKFYNNFNSIATKMLITLFNKAEIVLLMNENPMVNFSRLINIDTFTKQYTNEINNEVKIYCYVEDYHTKIMINEYIDDINKQKKEGINQTKCNYETFDISLLRTRELLKSDDNYVAKNLLKPNIHSVIIGFGSLGHAVFDEVLNESVYNQNGKIDIDIIGNDIDIEKNYILNRISMEYVSKIADNHYMLNNENNKSDGELNIYFHNLDINDKAFSDKLIEINERNNGDNFIDNIYVCLKKVSLCIRSLNIIRNLIKEVDSFGLKSKDAKNNFDVNTSKISIYTRYENENVMADFLEKSKDILFRNVKYFKSMDDVLKIAIIKDKENIKRAIDFNNIYNKLYTIMVNGLNNEQISFEEIIDSKLDDEEKKNAYNIWKNDKYVNKAATWYLSLHTKVKKHILSELYVKDDVIEKLKEFLMMQFDNINELADYIKNNYSKEITEFIKIEHRRWNYYKAFTGFKYSENADKNKHRHDCLLTFEKLCEKRPDTIIYDLIPLIYILLTKC